MDIIIDLFYLFCEDLDNGGSDSRGCTVLFFHSSLLMMGNCASPQRQELELDETIYVFKVTRIDSNCRSAQGRLTVKVSELRYVNRSRTHEVVWAWQHIRKFACDGRIFTFEVGRGHKEGEGSYAFSCSNVSDLFLRVNNYIGRSQRSDLGQSVNYNLSSHTRKNNYPQQSGANIQPSSLPGTGLLLQSETGTSVRSEDYGTCSLFGTKTATSTALSKTYTDTSAHSGTKTSSGTSPQPQSGTKTSSGTPPQSGTKTSSGIPQSGTKTSSGTPQSGTKTSSGTSPQSGTKTSSGTSQQSGTKTATNTSSQSGTKASTGISPQSGTKTSTDTSESGTKPGNTTLVRYTDSPSSTSSSSFATQTDPNDHQGSLQYARLDFPSHRVEYHKVDFNAAANSEQDLTWYPALDQTTHSHIKHAQRKKKKKSHSYGAGRHARHTSLRSMSPLLEASVCERTTTSAPTSPNDVLESTFSDQSQRPSYVNLTPYANVEISDSSPPPLPPKGLKPSPPPKEVSKDSCVKFPYASSSIDAKEGAEGRSSTEVEVSSNHLQQSEEESLEGLDVSMENLDVFYPTSEVDKDVDQIEGPCTTLETCTLCFDGSKAIMLCHDCETSVCAECAKQHLRMSVFANHKLSSGLTKARSLRRRKSTGCLLSTDVKLKYADLTFKMPNGHSQQKESEGHSSRHLVVFQEARTRSMTCTDGMLDGIRGKAEGEKLASNGAKRGDMLKVKYSRMDFELTKGLQELRVQREQEQLLSTEERRAGFGNKYEGVKLRRSN